MPRAFAYRTILSLLAVFSCLCAAHLERRSWAAPGPPVGPGPPPGFNVFVGRVKVSDDGSRAVRLTAAGLELWDVHAGRRQRVVGGARRGWMADDGSVVVTASKNTLRVARWDGTPLCAIPGSEGSVVAIAGARIITRRPREAAVKSALGMTLAYKAVLEARDLHGTVLWSRTGTLGVIAGDEAGISRDGSRALIDWADDRLHLIDMATGATVWSGAPNAGGLYKTPLRWKARGLAWTDGRLHVVDAQNLVPLKLPNRATAEWISPDASRLVVRLPGGEVAILDTATGNVVKRVHVPFPFVGCRLDGTGLAVLTGAMKERRIALNP